MEAPLSAYCSCVCMQGVDQSRFNYAVITRGHTSVGRQLYIYTHDAHRIAVTVHSAT